MKSDEYAPDWKDALESYLARENEPELEEPGEEEPPLEPPVGALEVLDEMNEAPVTRSRRLAELLAEVDLILERARSDKDQSLEQIKADVRRAIDLCHEAEALMTEGR